MSASRPTRPRRPRRSSASAPRGLSPLAGLALLVTTLAVGTAPACDKVEQASQAERQRANEQVAIQAYSAAVPHVDSLLRSFTQIWREANELPDTRALNEAVTARVLPALRAYVDALRAMPTKTETLKAIHEPLVHAYEGAFAAFQKFADGLTAANIEPRYQELLGALDAVMRAEDAYYDALRAYYEAHGTKLVDTPAPGAPKPTAPAPPGAATPAPTPPPAPTAP